MASPQAAEELTGPTEKGAVVDAVKGPVAEKAGDKLRVKYTDGFDPSGTEPKSYDVIGDPVLVVPRYQVSIGVAMIADAADTVARRAAVETPQRAAATVIIVRNLI
jgi:hypothetical protein